MYADTSRPIISIPTKQRQPFFLRAVSASRRFCLASFLSRVFFLPRAVPVSRFFSSLRRFCLVLFLPHVFVPCAVPASRRLCLAVWLQGFAAHFSGFHP